VDRHKYLSFGVVSQGIELLGACLDENEFDKQGQSANRFNMALHELFPEHKYDDFGPESASDVSLYRDLRCGFLHNVLPKKAFSLTEIKNAPSRLHLTKVDAEDGSQRYLLVAEEFYGDFVSACETLIHMIETKEIMEKLEIKKIIVRIRHLSGKRRHSKDERELQGKGKKYAILNQDIDFLNTNLKVTEPIK